MTFARHALAAAFAAVVVAGPIAAQSGPATLRTTVQPASSVCLRDLGGAQCGRYQQHLVEAAARRTAGNGRAAPVAEIGLRQLDVLIASIS